MEADEAVVLSQRQGLEGGLVVQRQGQEPVQEAQRQGLEARLEAVPSGLNLAARPGLAVVVRSIAPASRPRALELATPVERLAPSP